MSKYSKLQDGNFLPPSDLPFRITLDNGDTRTNLESLSAEELVDLGYFPVVEVREGINEDQAYGTPNLEFDGELYVTATYPIVYRQTLSELVTELTRGIDKHADAVRAAAVGEPTRVSEYQLAEAEAKAFRDSNFIGGAPQSVKSWADAKGWTPTQAANDILAVAAAWKGALYGLRDARLKGKEAIKAAADHASARAAFNTAMAAINYIASQLSP